MRKKVVALIILNIALVCLVVYLAITFPPKSGNNEVSYNRDVSLATRPLIFSVRELKASDNYLYAKKNNSFAGPYKARVYLTKLSIVHCPVCPSGAMCKLKPCSGSQMLISDVDRPLVTGPVLETEVPADSILVDASVYVDSHTHLSEKDFLPYTLYIVLLKPGVRGPELIDYWVAGTDPNTRLE